jgi:hypothetical protein
VINVHGRNFGTVKKEILDHLKCGLAVKNTIDILIYPSADILHR